MTRVTDITVTSQQTETLLEQMQSQVAPAPRIYYLHPLLAGPLDRWPAHIRRAAALGFDSVLVGPVFAPAQGRSIFVTDDPQRLHVALGADGDSLSGLARIAQMIRAEGLVPLLDWVFDRVAINGRLAAEAPWLYPVKQSVFLDPRSYGPEADAVQLTETDPKTFAAWWAPRLVEVARTGFAGFRVLALACIGAPNVTALIASVRQHVPQCRFLGWTPGIANEDLSAYIGSGLDFVFSSLPWWNYADRWLTHQTAILRRIAPVIASPEAPFGPRLASALTNPAMNRRAIGFAAAAFDGWMLVMGGEYAANERLNPRREANPYSGEETADDSLWHTIRSANSDRPDPQLRQTHWLVGPDSVISAMARAPADLRFAKYARFVIINNDLRNAREVSAPAILTAAGGRFLPFRPDETLVLQPGQVMIRDAQATPLPLQNLPPITDGALKAARSPRLAIEAVTPAVDDGRFPVRRIAGELVIVEADIICDGHDVLGVMLLWREHGVTTWEEQKMSPLGNDRYRAAFPLARIGFHEFTIEAWRDEFATFRDGFAKKRMAGVVTAVDCEEGRQIVARAITDAPAAFRETLTSKSDRLRTADDTECSQMLLSEELAALMARVDPRHHATRTDRLFTVEAERLAARFASWYEIFPRSMSDDPSRHGNFDDVIRHLPRIAELGFDVLYFPPIHPIGRRNRKGRNNSLTPAPEDPGSPYAIGAEEGGHDAVHPALGTFEDFRRLIDCAADAGLEIALDFAVQCSPDHPWIQTHRDWFDWRPDGSIKYAENPPKKYQDIVNVDFYADGAVPGLWEELCKVVLFWAEKGVRIFRVDNPHTKPLPFWEWMIGEVKARYPDVIFLAEAFTKPKMMYRLAKIGFTQSYSYFTWRNEKHELIDYLTELTTLSVAEFFRPNFFVNTPDINPIFLQQSGRAGFVIRAVLAATLGGLWGVYNGFELCEAASLPGREEYHDSEKYQIRAWDWTREGNINAEIRALNRIRRENPALQTLLGLKFLPSPNPDVLCYEKALPDRSNVIIVAVNLDPHHTQEASFEMPLWEWKLPDDAELRVEDLMASTLMTWRGKYQRVRLDPHVNPVAIWRMRSST